MDITPHAVCRARHGQIHEHRIIPHDTTRSFTKTECIIHHSHAHFLLLFRIGTAFDMAACNAGLNPRQPAKTRVMKRSIGWRLAGSEKSLSSTVLRIHISVGRWSIWGSSIVRLSEWPRRKGWQDGHRRRLKKLDRIGYCATQQRKMKAVLRYTIRRIRDNGVTYCRSAGKRLHHRWQVVRPPSPFENLIRRRTKRIHSISLKQSGGKNSWRHARSAKGVVKGGCGR